MFLPTSTIKLDKLKSTFLNTIKVKLIPLIPTSFHNPSTVSSALHWVPCKKEDHDKSADPDTWPYPLTRCHLRLTNSIMIQKTTQYSIPSYSPWHELSCNLRCSQARKKISFDIRMPHSVVCWLTYLSYLVMISRHLWLAGSIIPGLTHYPTMPGCNVAAWKRAMKTPFS